MDALATSAGEIPVYCKRDIASLRSHIRSSLELNRPADAAAPSEIREVFLTGATGFVGRFFLYELLKKKENLIVHCLVRAGSESEGMTRLQSSLEKADLNVEEFPERARAVVGDFTEEHFGLSDADFADLSHRVDAVFHLAADLALAASYLELRQVNSFSIRNLLEFCFCKRLKHFFFASSMGIFPQYFCAFANEFIDSEITHEMQPDYSLMSQFFPVGVIGYPWSKLVAEQALLYAQSAGMPLAIFRLPLTGSSLTGYTQPSDIMVRIISAAVDVNLAPPGLTIQKFSEPADTLAEICTAIAFNPNRKFTVYHCCDSSQLRRKIEFSELGVYLKSASYQAFKRACLARGKKSPVFGHWMLIDQFAPYWFSDEKPLDAFPVCDQAIREDCPNVIRWENPLTILSHSFDWTSQPENEWPYSRPKVQLNANLLATQAKRYAEKMDVLFEDAYPNWMLEGMRRMVDGLNALDSIMLESRRGTLAFRFSRLLYGNAALAQERKLHPEIKNEVIDKPIFILGINRTGTTFLHRLLARDQRFWTLKTYELIESVFPSDEDPSVAWTSNDPRRQIAKKFIDASRVREAMSGIHHIDLDEPEEDFKLLNMAFASWVSTATNYIPKYSQWLEKTGSKNAYLHHYRTMQYFNWLHRTCQHSQVSKRWLFKMPFHLMELECLIKAYPDAAFIQTHRTPIEFLPSWISLVRQIRSFSYELQEPGELGREQLNLMSKMMRRAIEFRTGNPNLENRWIDINFIDLVANPMNVVTDIYERLNWTLDSKTADAMQDWISQQAEKRRKETRHHYQLSDYALTEEMVESEFEPYFEFIANIKF